MIVSCLGVDEVVAQKILFVAALMDFALSFILLFSKNKKWVLGALAYASFWGIATAVARPWSGFFASMPLYSLHMGVYLMIYRLCHGLVRQR